MGVLVIGFSMRQHPAWGQQGGGGPGTCLSLTWIQCSLNQSCVAEPDSLTTMPVGTTAAKSLNCCLTI